LSNTHNFETQYGSLFILKSLKLDKRRHEQVFISGDNHRLINQFCKVVIGPTINYKINMQV
jgi:hypothetical protein